jgi:SAM-dependent methyltransferase
MDKETKELAYPIIDVCCGSRMFYFDKDNPLCAFMDNRELETNLCDGRRLEIKPNIMGDFRNMPFEDNTFNLVIFDPPHLLNAGDKSWLALKYGKLNRETWKEDIKLGFRECFRVLKSNGTLIFKWNETDVKLNDILKLSSYKPIMGSKRGKTHFIVFLKNEGVKE